MDLLSWSELGIADSFGRRDAWDIVCAHGVILHGLYRDTYAFRAPGVNTNHHWGDDQNREASMEERRKRKKASGLAKRRVYELADSSSYNDSVLLPVDSCFGGLAIYK